MKLLETERGVSVAEDIDEKGRTIYRVMRGDESLIPLYSLQDAKHLATVIRPQKVACIKCGQTDVESFPAELGVCQLRVTGVGGWLKERLFGGGTEYYDSVLCPDCARKHYQENTPCLKPR